MTARPNGNRTILLVLVLLLSGCRSSFKAPTHPYLVIGIDGLEWDILLPLLHEGDLPHLAHLMKHGVYGTLRTFEPTLSPVIWTTIATGKPASQHGILDFGYRGKDGREHLYTSRDRKIRAIWNILSERGLRVNVAGWWDTWPAEQVNGAMVSQFSLLGEQGRLRKGTVREHWPAQTFPPGLFKEILPIVKRIRSQYPCPSNNGAGPSTNLLFTL
ncbi:MAG: alkaline phosphatase family protein, partial [Acidobacteriota bacterium]